MVGNQDTWDLACELARSGDYANVVMIERELRRRGVLNGASLTPQPFRRELLTRLCHAARNGEAVVSGTSRLSPAPGLVGFSFDLS